MRNQYPVVLPPDPSPQSPSLGELIRATLAIAAMTTGALLTLTAALWIMTQNPGPLARALTLVILTSILTSSAVGIWRMLRYERAERRITAEHQRRWTREDNQDNLLLELGTTAGKARFTQADIDTAVLAMLQAHFGGHPYTRGSIKGISDVLWNQANKALQASQLRRGSSTRIHAETLAAAWSIYLDKRLESRSFRVTFDRELVNKN